MILKMLNVWILITYVLEIPKSVLLVIQAHWEGAWYPPLYFLNVEKAHIHMKDSIIQ